MKTTRTDESPSRIRLAIEASAEDVAPALDRAFKRLAGEIKIPGFRQGKAPRAVLEARLDRAEIREAALREALPMLVARAVREEDLSPLVPPSVEVTSYDLGGDLAFDATVEVRPEIRLPDLSSFVVSRPSARVTDEELTSQLDRVRERFARLETVGRPARGGDFALIDIRGYHNDETIEPATATDLLYEIGSATPVPELDGELEAKRAGDILKFNAVLPENFAGDHAGKEISFQVLVKEVREKIVPAADDEFAQSASEFATLEDLRADLRRRLEDVKRAQVDAEVRSRLLDQVVDSVDLDPPPSIVEEEMAYRLSRFVEQLKRAGLTIDRYIEASGQSESQIEEDLRRQADRNVRAQMILEEIGAREEIAASEDEVAEEVREAAESAGTDPSDLRKRLERSGRLGALAGDIIRRKALSLVLERAEIRDEEPPGPVAG